MSTRDISFWLRGPLLEALLVVLGVILLTRAVRCGIGLIAAQRMPMNTTTTVAPLAK